ncbi:Autophagy-related protein 8i [Sesamum angolense]|uniref:Autophagy-related protein n=1 Tax=Sesamum angolense TaxID=2727404 RepID=A0AAE1X7Z2_9LAMI|nr:Autophagy-related protein 8i [Sesamum angolense]
MGKAKSQAFKEEFSLEERVQESQEIIAKYPDRVPVVAERYTKSDLPRWRRRSRSGVDIFCFFVFDHVGGNRFLVPRDMSVGQFIHILSARLHLAPGKALFVFVKNTLPQTSSLIESVYDSFKDEDGFLYMCYSSEKTFG